MSRMRKTNSPVPSESNELKQAAAAAADEWEVRPCGMLVQKRSPNAGIIAPPTPTIRVRVKHNSVYHEIHLSSLATFGELKKLMAGKTGLHPGDQKIVFRGRERASAAFIDAAGVRDKSKLVLTEDPVAQARRVLDLRRTAKSEHAAKSVSEISLHVDKLASQVTDLETMMSRGGKVEEKDVVNLIETLMNELVKLDGIVAIDGDIKLQRKMQVRRVQKHVERLDILKLMIHEMVQLNETEKKQKELKPKLSPPAPKAIVTTKWELFDSLFSPTAASAATSGTSTAATSGTSTAASTTTSTPTTRYEWELF